MFIDPHGAAPALLRSAGLVETYRRKHPGQGTENVCFCFENIFLECLWITSQHEIRSDPIRRCGLYERSRWREAGTSRFGLAWREPAGTAPAAIATWPFSPPYLPAGSTIDVAVESDDPCQPMMFRSPGSVPPAEWPAERRGTLQQTGGFGRVLSVTLHWPGHAAPGPALSALAAATILALSPTDAGTSSISLLIARSRSRQPLLLTLPA